MKQSLMTLAALVLAISGMQNSATADVLWTFESGNTFDNDRVGDFAGPFQDGDVVGSIQTTGISAGDKLNTSSSRLGIRNDYSFYDIDEVLEASSDGYYHNSSNNQFNGDEFWSFTWDQFASLKKIDWGSISHGEVMSIQSDDWIGLDGVVTGNNVNYNPLTGEFQMDNGNWYDRFYLSDLTGGVPLYVSPGTDITISAVHGKAGIDYMKWELFHINPDPQSDTSAVPEPGGFLLVTLFGAIFGLSQSRKRYRTT